MALSTLMSPLNFHIKCLYIGLSKCSNGQDALNEPTEHHFFYLFLYLFLLIAAAELS